MNRQDRLNPANLRFHADNYIQNWKYLDEILSLFTVASATQWPVLPIFQHETSGGVGFSVRIKLQSPTTLSVLKEIFK